MSNPSTSAQASLFEMPPSLNPKVLADASYNAPESGSFSDTSGSSRYKLADLPPMLRQYVEYKKKHAECVIFFQVGDFYEIFFEDAVLVSKSLNLTLTSRDKSSEAPIPMCGVPVSALDGYIERLVELGMSVAVVSQLNSSSFARLPSAYKEENLPSKIAINRELSRIVTPGIRLLGESGSSREQSFVLALSLSEQERAAISYSDPQAGNIFVRSSLSLSELAEEVARIQPTEIIVPRIWQTIRLDGRSSIVRILQRACPKAGIKFREAPTLRLSDAARRSLAVIDGFPALDLDAKHATQSLVDYIDETTLSAQIKFSSIVNEENQETLTIGATTRTNLELFTSPTAGPQGGVLFAIDRTLTAGGGRLLRSWMLRPLKNLKKITERYDAVDFFRAEVVQRMALRNKLKLSPDLERIAARIELQCVSPRELGALRDMACMLSQQELLGARFSAILSELAPHQLSFLHSIVSRLALPPELGSLLDSALNEELPAQLSDGGVVRLGFNAELDSLRAYQQEGRSWVADFERREQQRTGIANLKVKFNYVLGFFIEITKSQLSKVPTDYEKRQGTTSSDRFVTPELKERERGVLGYDEKALALERKLYIEIRSKVLEWSQQIRLCAQAIAELDVISSFAELADAENYVRPELCIGSAFEMEQGRHPVVEMLIRGDFVPNSLNLGTEVRSDAQYQKDSLTGAIPRALILTGPNMGGKSTFLRQTGILTIMAQMGSFVPAKRFKLGLVDQLFARIGASDNIAGGESTFMVEMREVVQIISASTQRSLILIDEVGRGTATRDGAALAQAIIEWLVQERECRILFATHFHSLTDLPKMDRRLGNISVAAVESQNEIIFTHEIKAGPANESYGLEVAKLAGVPNEIIKRSVELVTLNKESEGISRSAQDPQSISGVTQPANQVALPLAEPSSTLAVLSPDYKVWSSVRDSLLSIDTNTTTPLEALMHISKLKQMVEQKS